MTLSYSSSRFPAHADQSKAEKAYYSLKSISALNQDLADPSKRASDSTIATVACLANIEVIPHIVSCSTYPVTPQQLNTY